MVSDTRYPRELAGGRWQGASGKSFATRAAAERDTGGSPADKVPTVLPSSKWRTRSVAGLIILALCLLLLKADIWRSGGNRELCGWKLVMIEAPSSLPSRGGFEGRDCYVVSGDVQASFRMFTATGDRIINIEALQRHYMRSTRASSTASADLSWAALLSYPKLVWDNRLPMNVFESPDRRRGYIIAPITDKVVLAGFYVSSQKETASSIQHALRLHLNPTGGAWRSSIWIKVINSLTIIFLVLPLAVVGGSRPIFQWFDRWWGLQTKLGITLYCIFVPGSLAFWAWLMVRISGWSTFSFLALLLVPIGTGQVIFNLGRDRRVRVPLIPFDAPDLKVFQALKVTSTEIEIAGAGIPTGKSLDVEMWFPRRAHCPACKLHYAVYVPTAASRSIGFSPRTLEDIPLQARQELYIEAVQAAPNLVNCCIGCSHPLAELSSTGPARPNGPFEMSWKTGLVAAACFAIAVLIYLRGGAVAGLGEAVPWVGAWLGDILGDFAGLIMTLLAIPALYLLWRFFARLADLNVSRQSAHRRMSACPSEGIVFEDIYAVRDMTCPSCRGERESIRHFKVVRV